VSNCTPIGYWYGLAASANGTILAAAGGTNVCTSTNFGQNWVSNSLPPYTWVSVAMSADAGKMVAVAYNGPICTAQFAPPSLSASLSGANLVVAWPCYATNCQLQQNPTLLSNVWTATTNLVILTNGQNQIVVPATNPQNFYRLQGL